MSLEFSSKLLFSISRLRPGLGPGLLHTNTGCPYVLRRFTSEPKGSGDDTRAWGPPFVHEESAYFLSVNRNKKSIAVNLKDPNGAKLIKELARNCDILVENYLPGKLDEMGLGYKDMSEAAPQLIYCSITDLDLARLVFCARPGHVRCNGRRPAQIRRIMEYLDTRSLCDMRCRKPACSIAQLSVFCSPMLKSQCCQPEKCPGYGQTGPKSHKPGYDSIASAVSGMMHITGPEDGDPVRPGVAMTDLATGLYAHGAMMAGLLQRQRTGQGLHIDCNLLSSQVACLTHIAANYLNAGKEARRWGTAHESIVPYQGFKTEDGYLIVAAGNNQQFVKVCQVLNLNELAENPKYKTNTLRVQHRKELLQRLAARFSEKSTAKWLECFEGTGVPCGPINTIQQVFSDPQVVHNGLILEMGHPTSGNIAVPGPAVRFNSFEFDQRTPPPVIGQHTVEVLKGILGYSDDVINQLLTSQTVTQNTVY
ncbi:Succinate--hydroxymethylglutarate CoA-transferase [Bagarius yarrelli]|uniref:Succinate--hydroxymethylglutarate CoA-transferase n=1 Tax=Bagarius yarrelli TaxID=175774 RepID=A0A556TJK3_BAGYA|nr:Succinate--hydroxymethylglutarate CoA-transferase [Bagarius yarrelli]